MLHPLLKLIATQPQLLADHAEAYADLIGEEIGTASVRLKRRVVLNSIALCALGVGAVLTGVALMLWAVIPSTSLQHPWALLVVPLFPLVTAAGCALAARARPQAGSFDNVRAQIKADVAMLREVSAP
jgi:hypothetical protein